MNWAVPDPQCKPLLTQEKKLHTQQQLVGYTWLLSQVKEKLESKNYENFQKGSVNESQCYLVSNSKGENVGSGAVLERVGSLVHQDFLGGVCIFIRSRQQQIPLTHTQGLSFSAHTFEAVSFFHRVQVSLLNEVSDVVGSRDGCVLEEWEHGSKSDILEQCKSNAAVSSWMGDLMRDSC